MSIGATVIVIDDDTKSRHAVCRLVESIGLRSESFTTANNFLEGYKGAHRGCIVAELQMREMSGVEFIDELAIRDIALPVVVVTAHPETPWIVQVMKRGAITVLEKPCKDDDLLHAVGEAIQRNDSERARASKRRTTHRRIASLSETERAVMELMVAGVANKVIAKKLSVSVRTVENRRHAVFEKMQVHSITELVRIVVESC